MTNPIVSIGLPVHNGGNTLASAVNSILRQDFNDFELIISDNASTDETSQILEACSANDARVRYFQTASNIGAGPNHNRVFELARGRYFMWAAHDLECLPGMLGRCLEEMERAPSYVALVYPQCEMIDETGAFDYLKLHSIENRDRRPHRRLATVLHRISWVNQLYGLARSEILHKTRLIDSFASSDYVLLAELAMLGEIREVPEILVRRRLDPKRGIASQTNRKAWAQWLNPRVSAGRNWLPQEERLVIEYMRSALRVPERIRDRVMCALIAPYIHYRRIVLRRTGPWRKKFALPRRMLRSRR